MARRTERTQERGVPQLALALSRHLNRGAKRADVATAAQVGNRLVIDLANMVDPKKSWPNWAREITAGTATPKFRRARAKSLVRVFFFLRKTGSEDLTVDVKGALREFGLDARDGDEIKRGVTAVLGSQMASSPEGVPDTAAAIQLLRRGHDRLIDEIELAQSARNGKVELSVTIFDTPPFNKKDPEIDPSQSVGDKLAKAWFGSIDPIHIRLKLKSEKDFAVVMRGLVGRGTEIEAETDIVLGLYETAYRKIQGAEFVTLPGIANGLGVVMPLAALAQIDDLIKNKGETIWSILLTKNAHLASRGFQIITIKEEVGDLFCQGPCMIPDDLGASRFARVSGAEAATREYAETTNIPLFVGGRVFCHILCEQLRGQYGRDAGGPDKAPMAFIKDLPKGAPAPVLKKHADFFSDSVRDAPMCRIGAAVHRNEERFHRYMRDALHQDLIFNSPALAGQIYAEMLLASPELMVVPFEHDFPSDHRKRLRDATSKALEALKNKPFGQQLKDRAIQRSEELTVWHDTTCPFDEGKNVEAEKHRRSEEDA